MTKKDKAKVLKEIAESPELLEIGRKAIEDVLVEWRDGRMMEIPRRGDGFSIREKDSTPSDIIRFGPEFGLRIALREIAKRIAEPKVQIEL